MGTLTGKTRHANETSSRKLTVAQMQSLKKRFPEGTKFLVFDKPDSVKRLLESSLGYAVKIDMMPKSIVRAVSLAGKVIAIMDGTSFKPLWTI